ncbi:MAG: asparagine synthase (glutamine-hydrolyzing) [Leptospiraceae bacterium]|nr:asparagine synthase (glutamine-hydrolyzing) [Leptospiraceae bacterium]
MCGIAGIIYKDQKRPVDSRTLTAMAALQHHRGPDGIGYASLNGVGMSHARLSIIDLAESAQQPFIARDAGLLLAHNGEFYDFQRIRSDLTAQGARFRTKSDTEIVMHLYERYGLDRMLPHLRGEFAFALYDKLRDTTWLVRDRFGIKPLYWTETANGVVFGSEIKVIYAHPEVRRAFDSQGIYHQLMQTIVPGTTPYAGVKQVKPGHILEIQRMNGGLRIQERCYWDLDFPDPDSETRTNSEEFYIEQVREKLLEAIQLRLIADVPVGCYLSGGIDSCSILGLSAAHRQDPVRAFTIGFDDSQYDESPIARQMAEATRAEQDLLMLDAGHLYNHFVETHWYTERTIYNTLAVAKLLMSRHVNQSGYKVVLTGEGSDELFAGYPAFRIDMFRHGMEGVTPSERSEWERLLRQSNALVSGSMLAENDVSNTALNQICGFTPACLQPWLASAQHVPALLAGDLAAELKGYDPGAGIAAALDKSQLENRHPLDRAQYVWIKTQLEGQILTWGGDRVDMANSMEARPPFLDHHLAEAAVHIPPHLRIKGKKEKYVLREAMRGLLPEVLYNREKFPFMAPPAHTDPGKLKALQALKEDFLSGDSIADAGILQQEHIEKLWQNYVNPATAPAARVQLDAVMNHAIGIQILHRNLVAADIPALALKKAAEYQKEIKSTAELDWNIRPEA